MEEEFAVEMMSNRQHTIDQLFSKLSWDGVISVNVAGSTKSVETMIKGGMTPTRKILRTALAQELKNIGFAEAYEYDEYKSGFSETRSYVVAFKDAKTSKNWKTNQAETEIKLKNRIVRNNQSSGELSLEFFDAATMASYSKFSTSHQQKDMKETLAIARNKARQAVEQSNISSRMATAAGSNNNNNNIKHDVNSSCSNGESGEECENPAINLSEEQMSGESWSAHDTVRES